MSNKAPQPNEVLAARLQRLARVLDGYANDSRDGKPMRERDEVSWRAFANLCWQSAARIGEEFDPPKDSQ